MNLNKVQLIGRLTRDPELRTTPSGQTVTTVGIATNRTWNDKAGQKQEKSEFHNIVIWGRLAEIAGQYLTKGQEAYFEGRLETRSYTGKDGVERKTTDIVAENMQMGQRAQGSAGPRPAPMAMGAAAMAPRPTVQQQAPMAEEIPTINLDEEQDEVRLEDVPF
ncbi:MAG: Single-stranded DNA-binding protein [Candidatus Moranbacteria bacterium GW2011_GWC2_37_73]|nr:MAG: Single-stranded DNA-binding protein [Parcubacteria group bacterium GW2011_GWC1_36_108]KKQ00415.1 MAG: Single-stranded DNA-binding protein [Candidatus Moranbacteria bacterium GW2011_GWD1_36_198]KKQ01629.1 MAG: Single-stranded DNA-binding protein [Candidatus Moranbacteria bacterium GW2011_GWD2_36_198]KKQ40367.1 MAG: Single-stranded DNA-binding protein [Candidatus Moranbacteria bacterium GW2011_GWC2_37_73]HBI50851.1 single-stranded DNA-binding protein [Candidatus Moranbacteria bacterium]